MDRGCMGCAVERAVIDYHRHKPIGRILASSLRIGILDPLENKLVVRHAGGACYLQRDGITVMGDIGREAHRQSVQGGTIGSVLRERKPLLDVYTATPGTVILWIRHCD